MVHAGSGEAGSHRLAIQKSSDLKKSADFVIEQQTTRFPFVRPTNHEIAKSQNHQFSYFPIKMKDYLHL
jgi:hypothetical protein